MNPKLQNPSDHLSYFDRYWEEQIIPQLMTYIEIPAKSPAFDPDWEANGYLHQVLTQVERWIESRHVPGLQKEVLQVQGRTPLLLLHVPGDLDYSVLMYGHLDKQPEMTGWSDGLGPWKAVRRGDKLYGRGGADDGYAVFASLASVERLIDLKIPRPQIKIAIEFSEESGSEDLPFYFEEYRSKFGSPHLVICLDSGAGNYDQMWTTTSLRGLVNGTLRVDILKEGVHSGDASGIVPSSFRIARQILDRLEDPHTGRILPEGFHVEIPSARVEQARRAAQVLGDQVYTKFPFVEGAKPNQHDLVELILNRTWRAALSVTGAEGLPLPGQAGNVLRPHTTLKLSLRLPPTLDAQKAAQNLQTLLESEPPQGAKVIWKLDDAASGWHAPVISPTLERILQESSQDFYGREALAMGEGGSIPFMGMIGKAFPKAQFVITGVLGPLSNAHGPNEFIHLDYAKRLTAVIFNCLSRCPELMQECQ